MKKIDNFIVGAWTLFFTVCLPQATLAVSAMSTVNVTVVRFMSIINVQSFQFGAVSVGASPGTVVVKTDGARFSTGGVQINPADSSSPARFFIEGTPYSNYFVNLPNSIELKDKNGNRIMVDQFEASNQSGQLDSSGTLDLSIGGQLNLDADQPAGDYSGTLIVELDYS